MEGLSQIGKSHLINRLIEEDFPRAIKFKGSGGVNVGVAERWFEYNFWMHNIIERLDELNDYNIPIFWDRGISEAVYSQNPAFGDEILRIAKSHKSKRVVYLQAASYESLANIRQTKEGSDAEDHANKYNKIVQSFDRIDVKVDKKNDYYTDKNYEAIATYISEQINGVVGHE